MLLSLSKNIAISFEKYCSLFLKILLSLFLKMSLSLSRKIALSFQKDFFLSELFQKIQSDVCSQSFIMKFGVKWAKMDFTHFCPFYRIFFGAKHQIHRRFCRHWEQQAS